MKKLTLVVMLMLGLMTITKAQTASLQYVLPDSVEVHVNKYLSVALQENPSNYKTYCLLEKNDSAYSFTIVFYTNSQQLDINNWLKTNRVVLINDKTYPVVLDYDIAFLPTDDVKDYGTLGKRGHVNVKIFGVGASNYNIQFNLHGRIFYEYDPYAPRKAPTGW
ncbi:hypothetical protein LX64_05091 [Chitinophaga skermanii]|uniref:Uncharacterized protein n=1 Tax=Chitinophaga skermanii TaxID=331697 RepID=A0A327Q0L5_9BACT|nr:hypothetical protein [Chitinophaga skermanii]RAI97583.1 hypothetical protein LX64_05091 [Chitinophaga skermanii]